VLYPLSYGGQPVAGRGPVVGRKAMYQRKSRYPFTAVRTITFLVLFSTPCQAVGGARMPRGQECSS
jgi:hypothetical protein